MAKVNCRWMAVTGVAIMVLSSCYPSEDLNVPVQEVEIELTELDQFIDENYTQEYGMAIRYRFIDNYLSPGQVTTPPE